MHRETGPGRLNVEVRTAGYLQANLYNFDFDDFAQMQYRPLKAEHRRFLLSTVVPRMQSPATALWLCGSASRVGTDAWNMTTSKVRAGRVATFLMSHGVSGDQIQQEAVGEERASKNTPDSGYDRSVRLWLVPGYRVVVDDKPVPTPIPPKPPRQPTTTVHFAIRMVWDVSSSAGGAAPLFPAVLKRLAGAAIVDVALFEILDRRTGLACKYLYTGVGIGASPPKLEQSGTLRGPWNRFATSKAIGVWQFGGLARFTTAGAWSVSQNYFYFSTPHGVDNVYLELQTGTTIGAGISSSVGWFSRACNPYRYPGNWVKEL